MNKCPNCGGIFPLNSFVCDYCGYVESEKLKQISSTDSKEISFEESLNVIQDNLNALHDINKPTVKNGIVGVLRVIAAIYTFGIVLIFWKKPKKRFNKKSYDSLKIIIKRNIDFLKISSKGSNKLLNRIQIVEKELEATDIEVKRSLKAKRLTAVLTIGLFVAFIFINYALNPILEKEIYPSGKSVSGDLKNTLGIIPEAYKLTYYKNEYIKNIKLNIKLTPTNKFILKDNEELDIILQLTDKEGNSSEDFYSSELKSADKNLVVRKLKKGSNINISIRFEINEKKALKEIPPEITKFKIITEIKQKNIEP